MTKASMFIVKYIIFVQKKIRIRYSTNHYVSLKFD